MHGVCMMPMAEEAQYQKFIHVRDKFVKFSYICYFNH